MTPPRLLIVGASTRAAAFSAVRAGFRPECVDQFVDADLEHICRVSHWEAGSDGDEQVLAAARSCRRWIYTGSLECRADLVGRMASCSQLLGNGPNVLRRVRDPWQVAEALEAEALPTLALRRPKEKPPEPGRWVRKSKKTAGGLGVTWASEPNLEAADPDNYFQEYVEGPVYSGLFLGTASDACLMGIARQFQCEPASPFLYRGGVGPWQLEEGPSSIVSRIGQVLWKSFGLSGFFGVDFVLRDDRPWLLEVNPRYTASVELFELAWRRSILLDHVRACMGEEVPEVCDETQDGRVVGKRVLYAPWDLVYPKVELPRWNPAEPFDVPDIADVPHTGTVVQAGAPVMTVLASSNTPEGCLSRLDDLEREWLERIR